MDGTEFFVDLLECSNIQWKSDLPAFRSAMGRRIKGQYFISLPHQERYVAVKIVGSRFKSMNDETFLFLWKIPTISLDVQVFDPETDLFGILENRRFFLPGLPQRRTEQFKCPGGRFLL